MTASCQNRTASKPDRFQNRMYPAAPIALHQFFGDAHGIDELNVGLIQQLSYAGARGAKRIGYCHRP